MPDLRQFGKDLMEKARQALRKRNAMSTTRKKMKRASGSYSQEGAGTEKRNYRVTEKSPIGKAQARNKRMKNMLDELD